MTDRTSKDSFLAELERAAKGLSVVTDRASSDELRRLFSELHDDEMKSGEIRSGENEVEISSPLPAKTRARAD